MKTRGDVIREYKEAFENGTEGVLLLESIKMLNRLNCSDSEKAQCLK